jgi:hypothetical protein
MIQFKIGIIIRFFCVVDCERLSVYLSLFFWSLYGLSVFGLWFLIAPLVYSYGTSIFNLYKAFERSYGYPVIIFIFYGLFQNLTSSLCIFVILKFQVENML